MIAVHNRDRKSIYFKEKIQQKWSLHNDWHERIVSLSGKCRWHCHLFVSACAWARHRDRAPDTMPGIHISTWNDFRIACFRPTSVLSLRDLHDQTLSNHPSSRIFQTSGPPSRDSHHCCSKNAPPHRRARSSAISCSAPDAPNLLPAEESTDIDTSPRFDAPTPTFRLPVRTGCCQVAHKLNRHWCTVHHNKFANGLYVSAPHE